MPTADVSLASILASPNESNIDSSCITRNNAIRLLTVDIPAELVAPERTAEEIARELGELMPSLDEHTRREMAQRQVEARPTPQSAREAILQALRDATPTETPAVREVFLEQVRAMSGCSVESSDAPTALPDDVKEMLPADAHACHERSAAGVHQRVQCANGAEWRVSVAGNSVVELESIRMSEAEQEALNAAGNRFEALLLPDGQ